MADQEEMGSHGLAHLENTTVSRLIWEGVTVSVRDRRSSKSKIILDKIGGVVEAGELLAIMGPSCVFSSFGNHQNADVLSQRLRKVNTAQRARKPWPSSEI
jgi:hypothetical protein